MDGWSILAMIITKFTYNKWQYYLWQSAWINKNHHVDDYISHNHLYISMADTTLFTATYVGMFMWNMTFMLWFLFMHFVSSNTSIPCMWTLLAHPLIPTSNLFISGRFMPFFQLASRNYVVLLMHLWLMRHPSMCTHWQMASTHCPSVFPAKKHRRYM